MQTISWFVICYFGSHILMSCRPIASGETLAVWFEGVARDNTKRVAVWDAVKARWRGRRDIARVDGRGRLKSNIYSWRMWY